MIHTGASKAFGKKECIKYQCVADNSFLLFSGQEIQFNFGKKFYEVYCEGIHPILTAKVLKDIYLHMPLSLRRGGVHPKTFFPKSPHSGQKCDPGSIWHHPPLGMISTSWLGHRASVAIDKKKEGGQACGVINFTNSNMKCPKHLFLFF